MPLLTAFIYQHKLYQCLKPLKCFKTLLPESVPTSFVFSFLFFSKVFLPQTSHTRKRHFVVQKLDALVVNINA